jgi:hypothetical protein
VKSVLDYGFAFGEWNFSEGGGPFLFFIVLMLMFCFCFSCVTGQNTSLGQSATSKVRNHIAFFAVF